MDNFKKRVHLISSLSDGLYHDVFDLISVILGQTDILKAEIESEIRNESTNKISKSMSNIGNAADDLTDYLKILRELTVIHNRADEISFKAFLSGLSNLTRGYAQKIKDRKNIFLRFDIDTKSMIDFKITRQEIFDVILPIIVVIFDNAESSGSLNFRSNSSPEKEYLLIEFSKVIIGQKQLDDLLKPLFNNHEIDMDPDGSYSITFEKSSISFGSHKDTAHFIKFAKPFELFNTILTENNLEKSMG